MIRTSTFNFSKKDRLFALYRICEICHNNHGRHKSICQILDREGIQYHTQEENGSKNIIVGGGKKYIVAAHYDAVAGSPGANDNAASCAALLLSLTKGISENATVCFFDNEEPENRARGQKPGSTIFAESLTELPELILNLDVCGVGDIAVVSKTPCPEKQHMLLEKVALSEIPKVITPPADHSWMQMAGVESLLMSTIYEYAINDPWHSHWSLLHTSRDDVDTLDMEAVLLSSYIVDCVIRSK